ncbi:MAG: glycosyl transferase family 4 [Bacteroidales bacterium]
MKIGFDAKRAVQNLTGLGNYSRYIIEILSEYYADNAYVLFCPKKKENRRLETILSRENISFVFPTGVFRKLSSLWRVAGIRKDIRRSGITVFHGLSNELPFGIRRSGAKSVVTIHDLIFLRYPQYYKMVDRFIYRFKFGYACRKADKIIAVSECTKQDIISFFHIPEEKIRVVYQGCHPAFGIKVSEERKKAVMDKYQLPPSFLLNVGSIEARKNLLSIVKALKHIPGNIHLVAVGKRTSYQTKVEKYARVSGLKFRLHVLNMIAFDDLPAIYQLAEIFVYPSYFEGFGIPIVEALASGVPVVAATGSCLEEAGGQRSVYVHPDDSRALAGKISELLTDKTSAQQMIEAGKQYYAELFSARRIASDIMGVYRSVLSR